MLTEIAAFELRPTRPEGPLACQALQERQPVHPPAVWRLSRLSLAVRKAPPARRRSKEAHDQPEQHQATNPHPGTAAGELHKPIRLLACERKPGHYPRRVVHRATLVCFGWQPLDRAALRFPHRPSCERPGQARDASSLDESPQDESFLAAQVPSDALLGDAGLIGLICLRSDLPAISKSPQRCPFDQIGEIWDFSSCPSGVTGG